MKVIQHGKNPFQRTCTRCQCVFVYDNSDIHVDSDDGFSDPIYTVSCPECGLVVEVSGMIDNSPKRGRELSEFDFL